MKSEKIFILYRDKSYKWKKIMKLTKEDMNPKEVRYLLIPSIKNPLVFYVVLPDKRLLSERFKIHITMDIANIDCDNQYFDFIDRFQSDYETDSLLEFIEFISILYKINGSAEIMEDSWLIDGVTDTRSIYPVYYNIQFINHDKVIDEIDSGELPNYTNESELRETAFEWVTQSRMDAISSILLSWDSDKNSIVKLPILLILKNDSWGKIRYNYNIEDFNLDPDVLVMVRLEGFGSYYLTTYREYKMMTKVKSFSMDVIVTNIDHDSIESNLYQDIGFKFNYAPQIERDAFCRYIKEAGYPLYKYTYSLGDIYSLLVWISFSKDIIIYLRALFHTMEEDKFIICIRHIGKLSNYVCSFDEIMKGAFQEYLTKYIWRRYKCLN